MNSPLDDGPRGKGLQDPGGGDGGGGAAVNWANVAGAKGADTGAKWSTNDSRKECYNCHEVGHVRSNCTNEKRLKCFNCEQIGHVQKDCTEPERVKERVVINPEENRRNDTARKMMVERSARTGTGMIVLQAILEVENGKSWQVKRELGMKILQVLGLKVEEVVGQDKEVRGIQTRGPRMEFLLIPTANVEKYLIEDIMVLLADGVKLTAVREVGKKNRKIRFKNVPFHVGNREILNLVERIGKVMGPVTWVKDDKLDVFTGERCIEVQLGPGMYLPSKVVLGGMEVHVWYPGQQRTCLSCHKFVSLCEARGVTLSCRQKGLGVKTEIAVAQFYEEIGFRVEIGDVLQEPDEYEEEERVVNKSPVKRKGMENKLKQAGLVIKKRAGINLEALTDSLAVIMTNFPDDEREEPEIKDDGNYLSIEVSHEMSIALGEELDRLLGLKATPLVDAREGLIEVQDETEYETDEEPDQTEEENDEEPEKMGDKANKAETRMTEPETTKGTDVGATTPKTSFQERIKKLELAAQTEGIVPYLYKYQVPEEKSDQDYERLKARRLEELEISCRKGPINYCRTVGVWKGNKLMEENDRRWAEDKLRILRSEKEALKKDNPKEARKQNYQLKMHEKIRPVPERTQKRTLGKSGNSPDSKLPKMALGLGASNEQ